MKMKLTAGSLSKPTKWLMTSEPSALLTCPKPWWTKCSRTWTRSGECVKRSRYRESREKPTERSKSCVELTKTADLTILFRKTRRSRGLSLIWKTLSKPYERTLLLSRVRRMAPTKDCSWWTALSSILTRFSWRSVSWPKKMRSWRTKLRLWNLWELTATKKEKNSSREQLGLHVNALTPELRRSKLLLK